MVNWNTLPGSKANLFASMAKYVRLAGWQIQIADMAKAIVVILNFIPMDITDASRAN